MQLIQAPIAPSKQHDSTMDLDVLVLSDEDLACVTGGLAIGPGSGWTDSVAAGPGNGW